jgi:hypothetical protein
MSAIVAIADALSRLFQAAPFMSAIAEIDLFDSGRSTGSLISADRSAAV